MLHATRFRSQPSVHFLQYEWFGLRAQTKSRLHIIRIFLSSFCYYLNTRHSNFSLRWCDEGNVLLSLEHIHSGIIAGVTIFTRCNVLSPDVDRMQLFIVPRSVLVTRPRLVTGCHDSVTKVRGCHVVTNQTDTCDDVCSCHNTASSCDICQH